MRESPPELLLMSTIIVCPTCGGVKGADASMGSARRCTCSGGSGVGAPVSSTLGKKICSVCGKDVTNARRMKDSATGTYWCYDCGAADQMKKGAGLTMVCPECKKSYKLSDLVKDGDHYVCVHCNASHHSRKRKGTFGGSGSDEDARNKRMKLLGGLLLGVAVIVAVLYALGVL
jgi:hypothetical protein